MPQPLTARVTPDGATSFDATITNLTPSSLFLRAPCDLRFRQSVTMELGALTLYGEVSFVCHEPPGAVVVFRASAEDLHTLEDHMDETPVVEGGEPWTPLSDEDPTNPAGKAMAFDGSAVITAPIDRRVPAVSTDVDAKLATVIARPSDRAPTHGAAASDPNEVPTVDEGVDLALYGETYEATILEDASSISRQVSFDTDPTENPLGPKDDADD